MDKKYYPDKTAVDAAAQANDPLLVLISFSGDAMLVSNIDDAMEHSVLLKKLGFRETDIDKYFRLVVNKSGADWTFASPSDYKGIKDRNRRIEAFYNDGIVIISSALKEIGYAVPINIPDRYRRHFDVLSE
jgi:hypothetical protein